ncbi:MAG: hypothetical protein ACI4L1_03605 [Christensenellales bacterium]
MNLIFIAGLAETIKNWFAGWFGAIFSIIPKTLYFLCTLIFQIMDILQVLVRKVAGLDVYYVDNTVVGSGADLTMQKGDIAQRFISEIFTGKNAVLSNVFWALIILGLIMLIITTFVAVLRSEYQGITDGKAASKGKIIGKAFKAIAAFVIVPIVCYFGIFLANVILQALDTITTGSNTTNFTYSDSSGNTQSVANKFSQDTTATGVKTYIGYSFGGFTNSSTAAGRVPTTSTPISGLIFKASAYQSNRIRNFSSFRSAMESNSAIGAGVFDVFGTDYDTSANLLDDCFANCYRLNAKVSVPVEPFHRSHMWPLSAGLFGAISDPAVMSNVQVFDKNNVTMVWYYYDLWSFNYVICIAALVVCTKLLISLVFGLMKRLFEVVVLFLIAPPIASLMPLDDGAGLKKWQGKFVGKVIGAYGPVIGLNLMFLILPFIMQIRFFGIAFVDSIVNVFLVIVGLLTVKDTVATVSDLIGAEDTLASGEKMAGDVGSTLQKMGKVATAPARLAVAGGTAVGALSKIATKKAAQNAFISKNMTGEQKAAYEKMGAKSKRDYMKGLRAGLSDEQKEQAEADYAAAHPTIGQSIKTRKQNRDNKNFQKAQDEMQSVIGAKRIAGDKWESMSDKEKKQAANDYKSKLSERQYNLDSASAAEKYGDGASAELHLNRALSLEDQLGGAKAIEKDAKVANEIQNTVQKGKQMPDESGAQFAKGAKEFGKALSDILKSLGAEMGGQMAKGFKDAGGAKDWLNNMTGGIISKKQDDAKAVSDAVKQLKTQQAAQAQVDGGKSTQQEVQISESSAKAIADAIIKGLPKK